MSKKSVWTSAIFLAICSLSARGADVELLSESFSASSLSGWSVIDQGNKSAPSRWKQKRGRLEQTSNIGERNIDDARLRALGTFMTFDGGAAWTNYRFEVDLRSDDDDTVGAMFRVNGPQDYYRFSWDRQANIRRLMRFSNGEFTVLAEDEVSYEKRRTYRLTITADDASLEVSIDGGIVFQTNDSTHADGSVALYTASNRSATFDNVLVTGLSDGSGPPTNPDVLTEVDGETWDETAVRKVLHAFAFGGQAGDAQIALWADMQPSAAISEMLTVNVVNAKLSDVGDTSTAPEGDGTLYGLSAIWSSDAASNPVRTSRRVNYAVGNFSGPMETWLKASVTRGLNPFRQMLGLWETNYHMAVNQRAGVSTYQLIRYFDDVMNAHADVLPYQYILSTAALSAAVTRQYRHYSNRYVNGECRCNEDFAREFHQLFFGILGQDDPQHEVETIKNTALALTDMTLRAVEAPYQSHGEEVVFGETYHPQFALSILNEQIEGANAAQKIDNLSDVAIEQPESLQNLPVKLISGLGDDKLSDEDKAALRTAWAEMPVKNALAFLRRYATSKQFHSSERVKHLSVIERHSLIRNVISLDNRTHDLEVYGKHRGDLEKLGLRVFSPKHNVFGGETGLEAAASGERFRQNFNMLTADFYKFGKTKTTVDGVEWRKDWALAVPLSDGRYRVKDVAEWLWQRIVADGYKNFRALERAHVYALLAQGKDLGWLLDASDPARVIESTELEPGGAAGNLVASLGDATLELASEDASTREKANLKINQAVNFILATPFTFVQEGR